MSVLVYAEHQEGVCKKTAWETTAYAAHIAKQMDVSCHAVVIGSVDNAADLGRYGATSVIQIDGCPDHLDSVIYTRELVALAQSLNTEVVILSHTSTGKSLAGGVAVQLDAALCSGVNSLPDLTDGFKVQRNVYSGKASATYELTSTTKVLTLMGNAYQAEAHGDPCPVEVRSAEGGSSAIRVERVEKIEGAVPLPEAELVVSGGRGFKGPEHWPILLELAEVLGAATACSRPVADTGWRPHHEHVGQTGVAIRPNLYIAIGISGAIQHLGGVNNSKTIVVINKDPEAPFFKAADYGVIGDLFEVVPRLTDAIRRHKSQ